MMQTISNCFSWLAIALIRFYQWTIRPLIGPRCRFIPHCSDYAIESYQKHGPVAGSWLTAKRLGRCHPWCQGGWDPVPSDAGSITGNQPAKNTSQPITTE